LPIARRRTPVKRAQARTSPRLPKPRSRIRLPREAFPDMELKISMTTIRGAAAAVTGAASGIGRALALELAARSCDLRWPIATRRGCRRPPPRLGRACSQKVTVHHVDVSEPRQIADFAQAATSAHPALNIVVNNAGVALLGQFNEIDQAADGLDDGHQFLGVVHSTRAFLPASGAPARGPHRQPVEHFRHHPRRRGRRLYAAAKFAVRGFSESLRHDCRLAASPVRLSVVPSPAAGCRPISRATPAPAPASPTTRAARKPSNGFDAVAKTAPRRRAAHITGIEKKPAAHIDRQRRPLHGPAARLRPGNLLGRCCAPDREGGEGGEELKRVTHDSPHSSFRGARSASPNP